MCLLVPKDTPPPKKKIQMSLATQSLFHTLRSSHTQRRLCSPDFHCGIPILKVCILKVFKAHTKRVVLAKLTIYSSPLSQNQKKIPDFHCRMPILR